MCRISTLMLLLLFGLQVSLPAQEDEMVLVENASDVPDGIGYREVKKEDGSTWYKYRKGAKSVIRFSNPWNSGSRFRSGVNFETIDRLLKVVASDNASQLANIELLAEQKAQLKQLADEVPNFDHSSLKRR